MVATLLFVLDDLLLLGVGADARGAVEAVGDDAEAVVPGLEVEVGSLLFVVLALRIFGVVITSTGDTAPSVGLEKLTAAPTSVGTEVFVALLKSSGKGAGASGMVSATVAETTTGTEGTGEGVMISAGVC